MASLPNPTYGPTDTPPNPALWRVGRVETMSDYPIKFAVGVSRRPLNRLTTAFRVFTPQ
jgi:hypothetical protein